MNNKGQVLVMFVLLLPLFFILTAYVVDKSYMLYESNKLNSINHSVINSIVNSSLTNDEIIELVHKNDNDITIVEVTLEPNIKIVLEKEINSIFGHLIGLNKYVVRSSETN